MADHFHSLKSDDTAIYNYNSLHQIPYYHAQQLNLLNNGDIDFIRQPLSLITNPVSNSQPNELHNSVGHCSLSGKRFSYANNKCVGIDRDLSRATVMYDNYSHILSAPIVNGGPNDYGSGIFWHTENQLASGIAAAVTSSAVSACHNRHNQLNGSTSGFNRNRYMPYIHNRSCVPVAAAPKPNNVRSTILGGTANVLPSSYSNRQFAAIYHNPGTLIPPTNGGAPNGIKTMQEFPSNEKAILGNETFLAPFEIGKSSGSSVSLPTVAAGSGNPLKRPNSDKPNQNSFVLSNQSEMVQPVTLQITNLDYSMDETSLRNFLMSHLKPITPVQSLIFEGSSFAKVTVPDLFFAKQVVSNLHRKKIGHKRMVVSYTRDSSLTEINTLRCQVAGLLKDVPYYTLPMYKFRELFQSRFKTSISVMDLYKMQDICCINSDDNEDKFISLQPELVNSLESSPLMEGLHHSVPYCTIHFKREQHKGWAEQEIEPLPNVCMTIAEIQQIIYPLLKTHPGDIPVATLIHCIEGELNVQIKPNENGVNLEHLVCCVQGIQIQVNNFGIKILGWLELEKENATNGTSNANERNQYSKSNNSDPLYQISREVIELVKMSPKSTMKFNRFIPAYHNHFGKQCRVADYGYTKLIELFDALSSVVHIMGDGENRQITLTHRTQIRRFTSDLLRVIRAHGNKSVLLSQLPTIFAQTQCRTFDVTDYGVCDIVDILDGLVHSNVLAVSTVQNGNDILISIPKRKQTTNEIEKTSIFAGEMVDLFRNAPQYTILFQKFVRSYQYHFAYQCRVSDYGFLKLADLMEAIRGVVEIEMTNDEDKKIYLSPLVARRVFAEQCEELITSVTGSSKTCMKFNDVLELHKKKFGYQIQPKTLGVTSLEDVMPLLPYIEVLEKDGVIWIVCHNKDNHFRRLSYRVCGEVYEQTNLNTDGKIQNFMSVYPDGKTKRLKLNKFRLQFNQKYPDSLPASALRAMQHVVEIFRDVPDGEDEVQLTHFMHFLLSIVRLLDQRQNMFLHEIKSSLKCNNTTTFQFGYPNIYSILTAHPDIFIVTLGVTIERSEVTLHPDTELRFLNGCNRPLYGSLKLPVLQPKNYSRINRIPLDEVSHRSNNIPGPPAKTRAVSLDDSALTAIPSMPALSSNNILNSNFQYSAKVNHGVNLNKSNTSGLQFNSHGCGNPFINMQQSNILNTSFTNKENSLNSSANFLNSTLNSSNASLCEYNSSGNASAYNQQPISGLNKIWENHRSGIHRESEMAKKNYTNSDLLPLMIDPSMKFGTLDHNIQSENMPLQSINNNAKMYDLVDNMRMYPLYQPPKPDTPPCENLPFWIDPIWSNNQPVDESHRCDLLNIKLPEMKSTDVLPMLISPYKLSKFENIKQQKFIFDNHDRKIA